MKKYYSTQRPIAPGTYPRQNGKEIVTNFYDKTFVDEIGREAWGFILYDEPLTQTQISDYELTPAPDSSERVYNGKKVYTEHDFSYSKAKVGDYVNEEVVLAAMEAVPPVTMRLSCAQLGEPYSHERNPDTGLFTPTYATFKCVTGDFTYGVWEYCGNCFKGETTERWRDHDKNSL